MTDLPLSAVRVLGLDPGLIRLGWGILDISGNGIEYVTHGIIASKSSEQISDRLKYIYDRLIEIIAKHSPNITAVEQPFVHKDPSAALKLGYVRAVAILAATKSGTEVVEYTPNFIKKSVVGHGHASKEQVQFMVRKLLPTCEVEEFDAADALAIAIAYAHTHTLRNIIKLPIKM